MIGKANVMLPAIIAASCLVARLACAQETAYGHITSLQTFGQRPVVAPGSIGIKAKIVAEDTVQVTLDVPFVNSPELPTSLAECKVTAGGYVLDPTDPGIKVNESVLLSAYLAGRRVRLRLDGCVHDMPRIVSVAMSTSEN